MQRETPALRHGIVSSTRCTDVLPCTYLSVGVVVAACTLHAESRGHAHRSVSATPARADSMCMPQPAQVGFEHLEQSTRRHMVIVGVWSSGGVQ